MGHPRPLVQSKWASRRSTRDHHHFRQPRQSQLSRVLACPGIRPVCHQSIRAKNLHQRQRRSVELFPGAEPKRHISLSGADFFARSSHRKAPRPPTSVSSPPITRSHLIDASQGVGALAPTLKDTQNRALAPEEILLFLFRPFIRWPLDSPPISGDSRPARRGWLDLAYRRPIP